MKLKNRFFDNASVKDIITLLMMIPQGEIARLAHDVVGRGKPCSPFMREVLETRTVLDGLRQSGRGEAARNGKKK